MLAVCPYLHEFNVHQNVLVLKYRHYLLCLIRLKHFQFGERIPEKPEFSQHKLPVPVHSIMLIMLICSPIEYGQYANFL